MKPLRHHIGREAIQETIRYCPIMERLEQDDWEAILPYLSENEYSSGTVILQQGQESANFHILLSGVIDVYLENEIKVSVAKLERGHFFGEMSCLTGERVSATIRAEGPVRTLSMPREGIIQLMDRSASFRKQMIDAMIQRIGKSNERVLEEHTRSFVVTRQLELERQARYGPLIGSSLYMRTLRERIDRLACQEGPICIVGEEGTGKFHIACEIHYRSSHGQHPLLSTDGASFHYDDFMMKARANKGGTIVLEQADRLPTELLYRLMQSMNQTRLVMTAREMPDIKTQVVHVIPLRERLEDIPELVYEFLAKAGVVHPIEAISQEAMRMLGRFPFLRENIRELRRVVQNALIQSEGGIILSSHLKFGSAREPGTRPTIGVALGSGSVRGAAHVGVLKVMEEENIPVDIITGTSVGAFIGALYAGGQPISAFEQVLPTVRWRQLVQFALSPQAFVDNHRMTRFIEKYIGPVHFEDLPIPFAAIASDAATGEACILNKGQVSHAICASTAIPGIMKPVKYGNRLLVDGGVVHPVPVALARSMGADIVIAVDVSDPSINQDAPKNMVSSILHTIGIMSGRIAQEEMQLADIVLNPRIGSSQITFKASSTYIQAGEKAAREAMPLLRRKIDASMSWGAV